MGDELVNVFDKLDAIMKSDRVKLYIEKVAAEGIIREYKDRIFRQGRASDGSEIGNYSTKTFAVTNKPYKFLTKNGLEDLNLPTGKSDVFRASLAGLKVFKKDKKTFYNYVGGYARLREVLNLDSSKVVLYYSGTLSNNIVVGKIGNSYGVITSSLNDTLIEKLESKYGKSIFKATVKEQEKADRLAAEAFEVVLNQTINVLLG